MTHFLIEKCRLADQRQSEHVTRAVVELVKAELTDVLRNKTKSRRLMF